MIKDQILKETTNNKRASFSTLGASNHSDKERESYDYYATPPIAVECLLEKLNEHNIILDEYMSILELACGEGHISEVLKKNNYYVISKDIIGRGYGDAVEDFLSSIAFNQNINIITNPPYKYAREFVERALETVSDGNYVIMFLKLLFLESSKRYELFKKYPPKYIFVFSDRITCQMNGKFENNNEIGGSVCYAWFVWEKGYTGMPMVDWIRISKK